MLFGCSFDNFSSQTYAYEPEYSDRGQTSVIQRKNMDRVLELITIQGIEINCYGHSNLKIPNIIS
ncbi:MAG: hypothetical protein KC550_02820 [Nanoarchaeota archaeon]|nr:hypothetical protein [Nanoarchaeota archaeon]